jgi:putative copper resistance protein D
LGVALLVAGLWAGGLLVLPELPGLPSMPTSTLWLLPVVRYARDIAGALTAGAAIIGLLMGSGLTLRWFRGWALTWGMILALFAVLTVSDIEALTAWQSLPALPHFLAATLIGQVLIAQIVLLMAAIVLSWSRDWARWPIVVLIVLAVCAPALVGHGGMSSAHVAATVSLALHLGAASIWMGGLAVVVALAASVGVNAAALLSRFSVLALWCVIVVAESGLLNASLRLPTPTSFTGTLYGSVILAKALLLGFLIRWGWLQRTRVVARLGVDAGASRLLAVFAGWELAIMGAAVAFGILLARIGPPEPGAPATGFTVVSLPVVALGVPLLIMLLTDRRPTALARIGQYPEAAAIAFLTVVVAVGVVGVLGALVGEGAGALVAAVAMSGAGWCWLSATHTAHSWTDVAVVMAAWPVLSWFVARTFQGPAGGWQLQLLSVAASEALLVVILQRRSRTALLEPVAVGG